MLTGKNVLLRAVEPEDIDIIHQWENNPEIWKVSNTLVPFARHIITKYVENAHHDIHTEKQLRLMIDLTSEKKTVGTIDLFEYDPFHRRAGVGILIAETTERQKGYGAEALQLIINYAFDVLDLRQLFCNIAESNKNSINLFEKFGFHITGNKQDWLKTKGGFENEFFLQLINPLSLG